MDLAAALAVTPVIAIVRLADSAGVDRALRALIDGGIPALEVTLTTPGALKALAEARAALDGSACLGAGSVRDAADAEQAIEAGARFLVTPTVAPHVVAVGTRAGVPVICGGLTPTELAAAHDAGAYAVKVFPATAASGKSVTTPSMSCSKNRWYSAAKSPCAAGSVPMRKSAGRNVFSLANRNACTPSPARCASRTSVVGCSRCAVASRGMIRSLLTEATSAYPRK